MEGERGERIRQKYQEIDSDSKKREIQRGREFVKERERQRERERER